MTYWGFLLAIEVEKRDCSSLKPQALNLIVLEVEKYTAVARRNQYQV